MPPYERTCIAPNPADRFTATVVDYSNLEALLTEKASPVPPGAERAGRRKFYGRLLEADFGER